MDICIWDLADNTITWLDDPDDGQKQLDMAQSRSDAQDRINDITGWGD
jgi:hypothetical protein